MQAPPVHEGAYPPKRSNKSIIWVIAGGCGLCLCTIPIGLGILLPVFVQARRSRITTVGLSSIKNVNSALQLYSTMYDGFPPAASWQDQVAPLVSWPKAFQRERNSNSATDWTYSDAIGGKKETAFPNAAATISLFESNLHVRNAHGPVGSMRIPNNVRDQVFVAFVDGHASAITSSQIEDVIAQSK